MVKINIFNIYFNFCVGHYYWWLQHLIFPSCSATFISITINHSSLLENMKGCNLNFSQRFSRKKEHDSLSTVSIARYCLVNWWISSIYQDWTAGSRSETPRGKFVKIANHDLWAVKHQAGLMFSTLLQTLLNLLVVTSDLAGPYQTRSNVNISGHWGIPILSILKPSLVRSCWWYSVCRIN